jgi:hypothetical protein
MESQVRSDVKAFRVNPPPKETSKSKAKAEAKPRVSLADMRKFEQLVAETRGPPPPHSVEKKAREQPKPKAQMTPEEIGLRRARLLRRINMYQKYMKDRISDVSIPRKLGSKTSMEELETIVSSIETELSAEDGVKMVQGMFRYSGYAVEQATAVFNPFGLQLSGPYSLGQVVAADKETWEPLATEIAIRYEHLFCTGPLTRTLQFMLTSILKVHQANATAKSLGRVPKSATVSAGLAAAVEDL